MLKNKILDKQLHINCTCKNTLYSHCIFSPHEAVGLSLDKGTSTLSESQLLQIELKSFFLNFSTVIREIITRILYDTFIDKLFFNLDHSSDFSMDSFSSTASVIKKRMFTDFMSNLADLFVEFSV